MTIEITDSHTHLDSTDFDVDRDEVIARAHAAGVTRIVTIGAGFGAISTKNAIALAEKCPFIWASAGVHPHDAQLPASEIDLEKLASHPRVVAIGETGLDFFKNLSPVEDQERWFRTQIELAHKLKKPLIIHSRAAGPQCLDILTEMKAEAVGGVFHCFAEDAEFAKKLLAINFLVSFPGTLTFKKAENVREVARKVPLSQIMVETDAPYMAPEPYRGKRCESAFVVETTKMLAQIQGVSFEECARITTENAKRLFKLA